MRLTFVSLILLTLFGGLIAATGWPNEPAGSTLLSDFDFSAKTGSGWTKVYDGGAIVSDPTAPVSPPSVLQYTWRHTGVGDVSNTNYFFPNGGVDNYYIGFWWKPSNPFTGWHTNQNKINLIRNDPNGHIYLLMSGPQKGNSYVLNFTTTWPSYSGVSNAHLAGGATWCDAAGICNVFPNVGSGTVTLGTWQLVEYYIQRSSTPTSRNGILRWWLNGKLTGNYENINTPASRFSEVQFAPVWDNAEPNYPNDIDRHWFDHIRLCKANGTPSVATPLLITTGSLPPAQSGKFYSTTLQAIGGKPSYNWTISFGGLLPGFSLNKTTGVLSGTPTTVGRSDFTIKVMDSNVPAGEATKAFTIIVSSNPNAAISKAGLSVVGSQLSVKANAGSVRFGMNQPAPFSLNIYDLSGREMWRHSGSGEAVWNHGGILKKGVYLVRLTQNKITLTTTFCNVK